MSDACLPPTRRPTKTPYTTHYNDVTMSATAFQITGLSIFCSTVGSGTHQRKHQSSASLAFVRRIHRWPVNSPHKRPVTRKCFHLMTSSWWYIHCVRPHGLSLRLAMTLTTKSRIVLKPRVLSTSSYSRSIIWQTSREQHRPTASRISKRYVDCRKESRHIEILRDLPKRVRLLCEQRCNIVVYDASSAQCRPSYPM